MKVLFKEINQAQEMVKPLVSIHKLTMSLKLLKKKKSFKDMVMS